MRPHIIAELSANHLGSFKRARKLIEVAAACGADAIKLQTYDHSEMVAGDYVIESGPWAGQSLLNLYAEAQTPWEWHKELFDYAKSLGIYAFSSPFSKKAVDFLETLDCPAYKIASFELVDIPLIEYCASTGKPLILSTGMAYLSEVIYAVVAAGVAGCTDITLLKCTSGYPSTNADANLLGLDTLKGYGKIGVSDHTIGSTVPVVATALGATMIEKHLTLSRADGGPDAFFSSEPDEFKQMVADVYQASQALGQPDIALRVSEHPQKALRRSLYFNKSMSKGYQPRETDFKTARPAKGLPPKYLHDILHKTLRKSVRANEPVTWECF